MSSDWRSRASAEELTELATLYEWRDLMRIEAAHNRARIKAIMNRCIQRNKYQPHPKKGVDTVSEKA